NRVVRVLNLFEQRTEFVEQTGKTFIGQLAENTDCEVSLADSGRTHKQESAIDSGVFVGKHECVAQRMILRSAGFEVEVCQRALFVATWNARGGDQLLRSVASSARARNRAFHRIQLGSGIKAFVANLCTLVLA